MLLKNLLKYRKKHLKKNHYQIWRYIAKLAKILQYCGSFAISTFQQITHC